MGRGRYCTRTAGVSSLLSPPSPAATRWRDVCSAESLPSLPSTALARFRKRLVGVKLWLSQVHRLTLERSGEPLHYESLPPEDRAKVAAAASQFLLRNDYVSLFEAAEKREIAVEELWNEIMADAGLPACDARM